ncbi:MAG TPA: hypothetical protein VE913_07305 [Longimicrobium sp.]|nr:hypothetical protein [Longimicrobium sp.]
MKQDFLIHEDQDGLYRGERRLGERAGIYLLDGGFHVANHASRDALHLREAGAILVATLTFSESEAERAVSGGAPGSIDRVQPLPTRAIRSLTHAPDRN